MLEAAVSYNRSRWNDVTGELETSVCYNMSGLETTLRRDESLVFKVGRIVGAMVRNLVLRIRVDKHDGQPLDFVSRLDWVVAYSSAQERFFRGVRFVLTAQDASSAVL